MPTLVQISRALVRPMPKIYVSPISTRFCVGIFTPAMRATLETPYCTGAYKMPRRTLAPRGRPSRGRIICMRKAKSTVRDALICLLAPAFRGPPKGPRDLGQQGLDLARHLVHVRHAVDRLQDPATAVIR